MKKQTLNNKIIQMCTSLGWNFYLWQPVWLRKMTMPNFFHLRKFVQNTAKNVEEKKILDAGAGNRRFSSFFSKSIYHSTDIHDYNGIHDFTCNLESIPIADAYYDAILSTEVLEHVKNPSAVMAEFNRVLKKDGKLFLTVPLQARFHSIPHHYLNFTPSGIRLLCDQNGFEVESIVATGGAFHFLSNAIHITIQDIYLQQLKNHNVIKALVSSIVLILLHILMLPLLIVFHFIDAIDKEQYITNEYICVLRKRGENEISV